MKYQVWAIIDDKNDCCYYKQLIGKYNSIREAIQALPKDTEEIKYNVYGPENIHELNAIPRAPWDCTILMYVKDKYKHYQPKYL